MKKFQSPSGVLGVCRQGAADAAAKVERLRVSVPFRGFRGLQGRRPRRTRNGRPVSVPFRGFRGLQDLATVTFYDIDADVSVPFRGFRGLQARPLFQQHGQRLARVSVPFRGFRGLQVRYVRRVPHHY